MLSKVVEQELYSRLSDQDKEYYKKVIRPDRKRTALGLAGLSTLFGVPAAYMHFGPKDSVTYQTYGDQKNLATGISALSGAGAIALTAKGPIRDFHEYQSYKRYCKRRGQVPMSISEFRKEIKNIK